MSCNCGNVKKVTIDKSFSVELIQMNVTDFPVSKCDNCNKMSLGIHNGLRCELFLKWLTEHGIAGKINVSYADIAKKIKHEEIMAFFDSITEQKHRKEQN